MKQTVKLKVLKEAQILVSWLVSLWLIEFIYPGKGLTV